MARGPVHPHHQRTLEALFAHPLRHGIRRSHVEMLLRALGAELVERSDQRWQIHLPDGQEIWIQAGHGPCLEAEAVLRLRHGLEQAGITPDHPEASAPSPRGDQSRRLVLLLDHRHTDAYRLDGDSVEHAVLHPHGIWGSDQNLSHRHDRDQAGQRAPLDHDYLTRITAAIAAADAVLLFGHGHGESDLRRQLLRHVETHRRDLLARIVAIETVDASALKPEGLLALARAHFGNLPRRHPVRNAGQELRPG